MTNGRVFVAVILVMIIGLALAPWGMQKAAPAAPTFTRDVAPVLYKNCASCHRSGDIAPMSLLSYEETRPWAKSIREKVASGEMPPWHANAPRGTFSNDRRLTDQEKETIVRWVDGGAPKGDARDQVPLPKFTEGWEIGTPDVVISMPKEYEVPASGTIAYQYFEVPTNFTEDKWVQAIEVRPGARSVVHHILVFSREPGTSVRPAGFAQVVPDIPSLQQQNRTLIATTAPGTNAMTFQPGRALRIKAGAVLQFQMHYTSNGVATKDRSSLGLKFATQPPKEEIRSSAFVNPLLVLPPGESNKAVPSAIRFTEDVRIYALFPHTHLRGKSWEYRLVYPDGRSEVVLSVPKYDFNWQTYYVFAQPLTVPKGARLEAVAHYDNSSSNPWNPDPKVEVRWGEQTWQEMQYSGITYSLKEARP